MPEIKQYTRQIQPRGFQGVRADSGSFGGQVGRALEGMGQTIDQVREKIEKVQEKRERSEYINKVTAFELENMKAMQELSQQEFEDDKSIAAAFQQNLEERASQLEIPESMQDQWASDFGRMKLNFIQNGFQEQARRVGARAVADYENTNQTLQNMVALDPSKLDYAIKMAEENATSIPDSVKRLEATEIAKDKLRGFAASSILNSDPFEFKRLAKDGGFKDLPNLGVYLEKADKAIEKHNKEIEKSAFDASILTDGGFDKFSKDHKKALDKFYNAMPVSLSDGIMNMDEAAASMSLQIVGKYKYVPENMQETIRGMMNTGTDEQKIFAYNMVSEINEVNGVIGFKEKEIEEANVFNSEVALGQKPEDALKSIQVFNSPEYQKLKPFRDERLKEIMSNMDIKGEIQSHFDNWIPFNQGFIDVFESAQFDFEKSFRTQFKYTGNAETAKTNAFKIIGRKYGVSKLMGGKNVMPYPPEEYAGHPYLTPAENREWMQGELKSYLSSRGVDNNLDNYELLPLEENSDREKMGLPPVYSIINIESGEPVFNDNNEVVKFYFDTEIGNSKYEKENTRRYIEKGVKEATAKEFRELMVNPEIDQLNKHYLALGYKSKKIINKIGEMGSGAKNYTGRNFNDGLEWIDESTEGAGLALRRFFMGEN